MQTRYVCVTVNNPTFEAKEFIPKESELFVSFAAWQLELGENGTKHVQGYVEFKKRGRFTSFKKRLPTLERAHLEPRKGTAIEAADYCRMNSYKGKPKVVLDGPWEFGTISEESAHRGSRSDLEAVLSFVREGATKRQIFDSFPDESAKFPRFIDQAIKYREEEKVEKLLSVEPNHPWQINLLEYVSSPPQGRDILWYYDAVGNKGKTYMSKYLVDAHGAFYCNGGKGADLVYAYSGQPVIIFDYVRDAAEYVNYGVIEQIKNGILFSSKYESGMKRFNVPHIIVMANFLPLSTKWSRDRYNVFKITDTSCVRVPFNELPSAPGVTEAETSVMTWQMDNVHLDPLPSP